MPYFPSLTWGRGQANNGVRAGRIPGTRLFTPAEMASFEIKSADISGLGESLKRNFCGLGHILTAWTRP